MRMVASIDGEKADILMSELLGSFGDNELSPECLLPTEKFLKEGGIYLPYDYTNHIVPIQNQSLWTEVKHYAIGRISTSHQMYPFELPYVAYVYQATYPCGSATAPVFTFHHYVGSGHQK
mmetsp:Transcript_19754/g.14489  ORF Transcript_19754/g.14489 Transcript_19754/m.14489 type:complete len:120 (+) Transcript_19754:1270-1629(+)